MAQSLGEAVETLVHLVRTQGFGDVADRLSLGTIVLCDRYRIAIGSCYAASACHIGQPQLLVIVRDGKHGTAYRSRMRVMIFVEQATGSWTARRKEWDMLAQSNSLSIGTRLII